MDRGRSVDRATSPGSGRLAILGAAALFSTGGAAIKLASLAPAQVACLRSGIAALVLFVCCRDARRGFTPRTLLVGACYGATMLLYVLANRTTTAASAVFLQSTAPLYVLLLSPLLLGEHLRRRDLVTLAGMALGLAFLLGAPGPVQETAPDPGLGDALGALAGFTWALSVIGLRWVSGTSGALAAVVGGNALVFVVALPFAWPLPASPSAVDVGVMLWLGVFQIGVAYALATFGLRRVPAFAASLLFLVEPALSPVWSWLVHAERPGAWTLVGGAVIALTVLAGRSGSGEDHAA